MDPPATSPIAFLDSHSNLRLVADMVHEDAALCLAGAAAAARRVVGSLRLGRGDVE
jgi:hypothetical protein